MGQKPFCRDDLPRLAAIVIASATFIYLLYDLLIKGNDLNILHFWILLIVLALVLGSIASRLRIFNFLEFNSKVESFRKETKRDIDEIRNQVSAIVQNTTTQRQFTIMNLVGASDPKTFAQFLEKQYQTLDNHLVGEEKSGLEPETNKFSSEVKSLITRAYEIFFIARALQIAIKNNRIPSESGDNLGTGDKEERTAYLIETLLQEGIEIFVPASEIYKTRVRLDQILKLINLKRKSHSENAQLPLHREVDRMIDEAYQGLSDIVAGIVLIASLAIVDCNQIASKIKELKAKFGISEDVERDVSNETSK